MAITVECEDRMHLSKRGRRWHRCFIRIEVASKHFLRSILVSILINMNMIVVIEIHHWIIWVFFSGSLKNVYDVAASRIHEAQSGWLVSGDVSSFGLGDESFAWNPEMASIGCIESIWSLTFFYLLFTVMYHVWFLALAEFLRPLCVVWWCS